MTNHEWFRIEKWYGGKQEWLNESNYTSKKNSDRSCGVAAAANIIQYLAKENPELSRLYVGNSKEDYIKLMIKLYPFLKPRFYGIPTIGKMKNGIMKFAVSKGIILNYFSKIWIFNQKDRTRFVKEAILKGHPVLLLSWNSSESELKNHWVTVTGWEEIEGEEFMIVSNWGNKRTYSYTKWINERSFYKGVLFFSE